MLNSIDDNEVSQVTLELSAYNKIRFNNITQGGKNGYGIGLIKLDLPKGEFHAQGNEIIGNTIENCEYWGIVLLNTANTLIKDNIIRKNGSYLSGVSLTNTESVTINNNEIVANKYHGIEAVASDNLTIAKNNIDWHNESGEETTSAGIYLNGINNAYIVNNSLYYNSTGVIQGSSKGIEYKGNKVLENQATSTGVHLINSEADFLFNEITGNNGSGIELEKNSYANVEQNNISGNAGYQVAGMDERSSADVNNNYWGNENGPQNEDLFGNVTFDSYLSSKVLFGLSTEDDTLYFSKRKQDSISVYVNSFNNEDITVNIKDNLNWLKSEISETLPFDTTGSEVKLHLIIPSGIDDDTYDEIYLEAGNGNSMVYDTLIVYTYSPQLQSIEIVPDSITIVTGDSLQISAMGIDQFGNDLELTSVLWTTTLGNISEDGFLTTYDEEGVAEVTVVDSATQISETGNINISPETPELTSITISPSEVTLKPGESVEFESSGFNQTNFPMQFTQIWSAEGGRINEFGFYTADSIAGIYTVTVTDTSTGVTGEALVEIDDIASANNSEEIPKHYSLSQNYPNPFNPATTIKYGLPVRGLVKIDVYNILGQRITQLVNKVKAAGYHQVQWNTSGLASGVYFYSIYIKPENNGKDYKNVKKMLMVK